MGAQRQFLNNLQVLRAGAAAVVVCVHLWQVYGLQSPFGLCGVDVFFVLSGFIMAMLSTREKNDFLARRLIRIVPLYWLCTFAVFFAALLMPGLLHSTTPDWNNLLKSLFFLPYRKESGAVQPLLFLGWTLNYEIFFYLIFAAVLRLRLPKPSLWVSVAIASLPVLGSLFHPDFVAWEFYTHPIVLDFLLGIGVYHLALKFSGRTVNVGAAFGIMFCGLLLLPLMELNFGVAHRQILLGLPAAALVYSAVCLERAGYVVTNRVLLLTGNASYVLYLTHPYVLQLGEKCLHLGLVHSSSARVLSGLALFMVAVLVACAVHLYLEVPIMTLLKRLFFSREKQSLPAPAAVAPVSTTPL